MCIICNPVTNGDEQEFLGKFDKASKAMKEATQAMFHYVKDPQYNLTHKKMVKLVKEWNALEQLREGH